MLYNLVNSAYLNLTLNWLCNAYILDGPSIHDKVLIVALDQSTCLRINKDWPKVACIGMNADKTYNQPLDWGTSAYARILWARIQQIYAIVEVKSNYFSNCLFFRKNSNWLYSNLMLFG